jgi:hypothetical protein
MWSRIWGGAVVALALLASGCSKKAPLSPDAGPVGSPGDARLVVWADSSEVPLVGPAATVKLGLFDRTSASTYRLWRQEPSGGYLEIKDYATAPEVRMLSAGAEYYEFFDLPPSPTQPVRYLAQGGLGGVFGPQSPLSNVATVPATLPPVSDDLVAVAPVDSAAADSLPRLIWQQLSGVAGYLVQIYQPRRDAKNVDVFTESQLLPLYDKAHNFFVAYVPADTIAVPPGSNVFFQVGGPPPPGVEIYEARYTQMLALQNYRWRVAAVTADGWLRSAVKGFPRLFVYGDHLYTLDSRFSVYFARRPLP